jgi:hypothetical protein
MSAELGQWLRDQREERGWSRPDMARKLIAAARADGDQSMPGADSMCHNIYRWERGQSDLSQRHRLNYCRAFGIKPSQFGPTQPQADDLRTRPGMPSADLVAYREIDGHTTVEREVLMAAHEGSDHAARAERRDIGEATLEQLRADVVRLSAESMTGDPLSEFLEMRRVRERIYRLLEGHMRPSDQADLYFLIGCLNDLMAVAASGLGYPQAAEELIRAGWAYATAIDHRPLMAHLRLQLASIAFWDNRPRQARDLAEDGLRYLADGPNGAHLHVKYARAAARLGDADGARRAIAAARDARERDHADDVVAIGGEFDLSAASQHYFAGSALLEIDDAEPEASTELENALRRYEAGPHTGEHYWFGAQAMASIDLATLRLRSGALDAAMATLEPALSLPPSHRISSLTGRMQLVRAELATPSFRGSAQARELDERIEDFARESVIAGLHSLPGRP